MKSLIQFILRWLTRAVLWKYRPFVVGITGSVGKSSTKEAIYMVLSQRWPGGVRKNEENLNTEIGLPLTVLGSVVANRNVFKWAWNILKGIGLLLLPLTYPKALVLEMAADRPGDIQYFSSFIPVDVAVITAVGAMPVHLEFFENREAYVNEKAAILSALKPGGTAVLNNDDATVRGLARRVADGKRMVMFGMDGDADVKGLGPYYLPPTRADLESAGMSFKVSYKGSTVPVRLHKSIGKGIMYAALAACAVGVSSGANLVSVAGALEHFQPLRHRMAFVKGIKGTLIIDDTYNASPLSAEVALEALSKFEGTRKIAVLGDMRELGVNTEKAHRHIAQRAADVADIIFLVGPATAFAREELEKARWGQGGNLVWGRNADAIKTKLQEVLTEGDVVLIKGSRAVMMDTLVEEIREI